MKRLRDPDRRRADRLMRLATYASTGTAAVLILAKVAAWFLTDSIAMLSSLIDSLLDLFASLVTLFAVRHALTPADREHRFGHGKAEPLAALLQSGFIAASAVYLVIEAVERLITPAPVHETTIGLAVVGLSIVATLALVTFQSYVIKLSDSTAVKADSVHYRADLLANLGVAAALVASGLFGLQIVDPLFGLAIAAYIVKGAWDIAREAYDMLMDRELPDDDRARIMAIARGHSDVLGVHDLRTRRSGPDIFIQMHLDLNGALSLTRAHTVADAVEKEVTDAFPGAEVIVHEDPVTPDNAPEGAPGSAPGSAPRTTDDDGEPAGSRAATRNAEGESG